MKVSFIIPALNASLTLAKCLESILSLEYPKEDMEVIVVDNGSKDDTVDIARKYRVLVIESNKKVSGVRNAGAAIASGEVLAFVDSDCILPKGWLEVGAPLFNDPAVAIAGSKTHLLAANATWVERTWKIHLDRDSKRNTAKWFGSAAILVRKEAFLKAGGFSEELETCEDVDLGYRLGKGYKIASDEDLAFIHLGEDRTLTEFFRKEIWRGKSSVEVSLKNLREPKELLSLAFIMYYLVMLFVFFPLSIGMAIVSNRALLITIVMAFIFTPVIIMAFDTCRRTGKFMYFGKLFVMYCVYIAARMVAIFK